jgi:hypothetical protein
LNRQGNDRGASYRSAIFYTSDDQKRIAEDTITDVDASGLWPGKVVTEVAPAGRFWKGEGEYQDYLEKYLMAALVTSSGQNGRCRIGRTKLQQAQAEYRPRDSHASAWRRMQIIRDWPLRREVDMRPAPSSSSRALGRG